MKTKENYTRGKIYAISSGERSCLSVFDEILETDNGVKYLKFDYVGLSDKGEIILGDLPLHPEREISIREANDNQIDFFFKSIAKELQKKQMIFVRMNTEQK